MREIKIEKDFLRDVAEHEMTILRDDGFCRHLRFKKPNSSVCWFDVLTWGGHLAVTGDMGAYIFSRTEDMFEFFRMRENDFNYEPKGYPINPGYWAEKLVASDCHGRHSNDVRQFCEDTFRAAVASYFSQAVDSDLSNRKKRQIWKQIEADVIKYVSYEHEAYEALSNFDHLGFTFSDVTEIECKDWSRNFIWILIAIVWGIRKYDQSKQEPKI